MAVQRRSDVAALDDEAFAAWRQQKMKELTRTAPPGKERHGRRRYAQGVIRKYIKMRRAHLGESES